MFIKPGPKRENKDGTPDKRQRTNTPDKHKPLKPHDHKPGD
ncbi:hypothetical protein [Pseudoalteromonas sp. S4488]|nr:hypothetical protein [Pseudoalteromonas sp. S4488]